MLINSDWYTSGSDFSIWAPPTLKEQNKKNKNQKFVMSHNQEVQTLVENSVHTGSDYNSKKLMEERHYEGL